MGNGTGICYGKRYDFEVIPGVHRAVMEFAPTKTDKVLTTECDVWYWYK